MGQNDVVLSDNFEIRLIINAFIENYEIIMKILHFISNHPLVKYQGISFLLSNKESNNG